jgi:Zn-dependent protease
MDNILREISVLALPVLFAITLHEAAHGYVARYFGDLTAYQAGRISLNPLRHIDPVGTVLIPLLTLFAGGFLFGWAKPVPVNFARLRHPKRDMLWVAAAGPGANLLMAIMWIFIANISGEYPPGGAAEWFYAMAEYGLTINVVLMVLNLMPIPPLDGGRIAVSLLPNPYAYRLARVEPYGIFILLGLLMLEAFSPRGIILRPMIALAHNFLIAIFGS